MDAIPLRYPTNPDEKTFFDKLFQGAMGSMIILEDVPTADQLKPGQWGTFGTDIYLKSPQGQAIKIAGASF